MSDEKSYNFNFLVPKYFDLLKHLGTVILGVSYKDLSEQYLIEIDRYITSLEDYFKDIVKRLLYFVNSRFVSLIFIFKMKKFVDMDPEDQLKFLSKWKRNRLSLFRSGYITLQSIVGWGYYVLDHAKEEIGHKGHTIGREHLTPTLLEGKQPWSEDQIP